MSTHGPAQLFCESPEVLLLLAQLIGGLSAVFLAWPIYRLSVDDSDSHDIANTKRPLLPSNVLLGSNQATHLKEQIVNSVRAAPATDPRHMRRQHAVWTDTRHGYPFPVEEDFEGDHHPTLAHRPVARVR